MKVLHAYCLNHNLGDYALGYGLKKALRELIPIDLIAEVNLQGQVFDEYFINNINQKYDLLVIGGGGIIHGAHWPQGWFWLIEKELIKTIKIPFIVYAAGYNYFKDEDGIPERGIAHLRETAKHARLFSVRNDGSYERLYDQTAIDAKVIADPGFWIGRNQSFQRPAELPTDYIVIQLANDKPAHRFGGVNNYQDIVNNLRVLTAKLAKKFHVVFTPHVFDDIAISEDVAKGLDNVSIWPFSDLAFDKVEKTFGYYQYASCVIAMRGHGQIVPLSFGVPTISLENHHKHRELMELIGMGKYNVDVMDADLPSKVLDLVDLALADRQVIYNHLTNRLDLLWKETSSTIHTAFPDPIGQIETNK
ncbi:MAG: polysaccharide pyruvyl transferase family protein [Methylococcales bacterium]|nr:polysaccharide pyruvyl transferase family protein [Methylococcales bacterium]